MTALIQKALILVAVGACLSFIFQTPLQANDWNHETTIMMNQPVEVPGLLLTATTKYIFKMTGIAGSRNLVEVYNANGNKLLTTFTVLPDIRLDANNSTVFTFVETQKGHPDAIKSWFFPDSLTGVEFLYPKAQARAIVAHSTHALPSAVASSASLDSLHSTPVAAVEPSHYHHGRTFTGRK